MEHKSSEPKAASEEGLKIQGEERSATTSEVITEAEESIEESEPEPPIAVAVDHLLHRMRDIEVCASLFIPAACESGLARLEEIKKMFEEAEKLTSESDAQSKVQGTNLSLEAIWKAERQKLSNTPDVLERSLFLGVFSAFDAFSGDLLRAIYEKRPELFERFDRQISVSDLLKYSNFMELKAEVLEMEIELFRRKSYVDQFAELEKTFGVTLTKFDDWSAFVESAQRRNLMTHCDGVVSEQYISICKKAGCNLSIKLKAGDRLELGPDYFFSTCELLMSVGLQLGQTIWRKLFPGEIEMADEHLKHAIYDSLRLKHWERAERYGRFMVGQPRFASDVTKRIAIINLTIALKFGGKDIEASKLLNSVDWSSSLLDFRLAQAVLSDHFDSAGELMKRIGSEGEFVAEQGYHEWPLFEEFRRRDEFLEAYQSVYNHPFAAKVQEKAEKAHAATVQEMKREAEVAKSELFELVRAPDHDA